MVDGMQKNDILLRDKNKEEISYCPFCSSRDVIKYGFQRNNVQRFLCNTCGKLFNGGGVVAV